MRHPMPSGDRVTVVILTQRLTLSSKYRACEPKLIVYYSYIYTQRNSGIVLDAFYPSWY